MAESKQQQNQSQPIEYSVYTLEAVAPGEKNNNELEKQKTTEDMDEALKDALVLFQTEKYQKVEVKKKYFEEKTGRTIEMTLRSLEAGKKKDWSMVILVIASIAAGAGAFALTFFLF